MKIADANPVDIIHSPVWIYSVDGRIIPLYQTIKYSIQSKLFRSFELVILSRSAVQRWNENDFHLENSSYTSNARFILMIIDALRSDYVFHRDDSFHLKSIGRLEKEKLCLTYQLKCHSPTVTLPRLKVFIFPNSCAFDHGFFWVFSRS